MHPLFWEKHSTIVEYGRENVRSVYVTGIGILSRIGIGMEAHQNCFKDSNSAGMYIQEKNHTHYPPKYGRISNFNPKKYIPNRKAIKFMSRECRLGCAASRLAAGNAGLDSSEMPETEAYDTALVFGAAVCDSIIPAREAIQSGIQADGTINYEKLGNEGVSNLAPLWILTKLPNTTAGQIAIQDNIRGINFTVVNGPTNGLSAIGEAFGIVNSGRAGRAFCGGAEGKMYADFYNRLAYEGIAHKDCDTPPCYQVDARGGLLGEGAAVVILENDEMVSKRQVPSYGKILAYRNKYIPDFQHLNPWDIATRYIKCMEQVIRNAGIDKSKVSMIQGCGFGYEKVDKAEALAIRELFQSNVPIVNCHSIFGYTLGASGAMSVAAALIQMKEGCLSPMYPRAELYFENELDYVTGKARKQDIDFVLINCFDYTGGLCSIIISRNGV